MTEEANRKQAKDLEKRLRMIIPEENILWDASMKRYISFKAGGNADALLLINDLQQLSGALNLLETTGVAHMILGSGSNLLVRDGGYRGVMVKLTGEFEEIKVEGNLVTAGAGAKLSAVARAAMEAGLTGFEFACGIPGSIGGGACMNAGAYGGELKDIILEARYITRDGKNTGSMTREEMNLGYRKSAFQSGDRLVTSCTFKLKEGNREEIQKTMLELMERRNTRQPVNLPSAGSFFKRPEGYFAGKLVEDSGLKGLSVGDAQVSPLHAGFIVNNGDASATDIIQLMHLVQNTVRDKFGVELEPEVRIIGEEK